MSRIIQLNEQSLPENCFVFKHSTRCPVSFSAADEVKAAKAKLPIYWVNVVEQRELSSWIAKSFGITHQSPQLILVEDGKPSANWSHGTIKSALLED